MSKLRCLRRGRRCRFGRVTSPCPAFRPHIPAVPPSSCPTPPGTLGDPGVQAPQLLPLLQATGIPEELYQRTYTLCMQLLTLPSPYCTIALDCAIRLKTETAVPGRSCHSSPTQGLAFVSRVLGSSNTPAPFVGRWGLGLRDSELPC